MQSSHSWRRRWAVASALAVVATATQAQPVAYGGQALADLSLEQLREVVVTTVSRFEERLDRVAASVYVISADQIARSGALTIPEALRLAPTLSVARADANQYAISARGFTNVLANKMLVLIDGRAVYTPLFSGVFWDAQDVMLEDIDRIEVVTGPSTALWGSNAVNGLIHVITRSAAGTRGWLASAHAGPRQRGAALRLGGRAGDRGTFRVYAKSYQRDDTRRADRTSANDAADGVQLGARADWYGGDDVLTLQADAYRSTIDQLPSARRISGGDVVARWQRALPADANVSVQLYWDHTERVHPQSFAERLDTFDAVTQYSFRPWAAHNVMIGGGLRYARDRVDHGEAFAFIPADRTLHWTRLFAQDHIELSPGRLALTLSGSLERNPYTGTEVLPGMRLAWHASETRMAWGALSRAVRAPSRIDRDFHQPAQPPHVIAGGPDFRSEVSNVLELGYRAQHSAAQSYALTLFHHEHRRLRSLAPTPQGLQLQNDIEGSTRGVEGWVYWRPTDKWRIDAGFVLQRQRLRVVPGAVDSGGLAALGNDPRHQASLRSSLDVTPAVSWDVAVRRVGALPMPFVPSYTAVDTVLSWRVGPSVVLALVGQNVTDARHAEWGAPTNRVEHERAYHVQLRWRH